MKNLNFILPIFLILCFVSTSFQSSDLSEDEEEALEADLKRQDAEELTTLNDQGNEAYNYKFLYYMSFLKFQNIDFNKPNGLIIFESNITNCSMYSTFCRLSILVNNVVNVSDLVLESDNTVKFDVLSIEPCRDNCPSTDNFLLKNATANLTKNYKVYDIKMNPKLIGRANIVITISNQTKEPLLSSFKKLTYPMLILQPYRLIDSIFNIYVWIFIMFISLTMGILLDTNALVKIIKMPIPVGIGLACQFFLMPLIAFGFTQFLKLDPLEALAIFLYGCSPGGSASNNWTIMFNGDIDLSAIMTFASTITSLGMMPFWYYTLGQVLSVKANISIPFLRLLSNLLYTIVPCLLGLILTISFPRLKAFFTKIAKPLTLISLVSTLSFMIYVKFYVFSLIKLKHWIGPPFIPYLGFLIAALVAFLFRFPKKQIITISIETGIQNFSIAFLIIFSNFPLPDSDEALMALMGVAFLTPLPLFIALIIKKITVCCRNRKNKKNSKNNEEFANRPEAEGYVEVKTSESTNTESSSNKDSSYDPPKRI